MEDGSCMEKRNQVYSLEELMEQMGKKKLCFDYPIQRESGQWDKQQKALLIDICARSCMHKHMYVAIIKEREAIYLKTWAHWKLF